MNEKLTTLLKRLELLGINNDKIVDDYESKYLNLEKKAAQFISFLVKLKQPKQILEIGTSNGYSTIWLASSLPEDGKITTVEKLKRKIIEAKSNFEKAGLLHKIELVEADANEYFIKNEDKFNVIFLDANRKEYMNYVDRIELSLEKNGLIICDNAISHKEELMDFNKYFENSDNYESILVSIGKGIILILKK